MSLPWERHCDGELTRKQFCKKMNEMSDRPEMNKMSDRPDMNKEEVGDDTFEGFSTPSVFNVQNLVKYLVEGLAVAIVGMVLVLRKRKGKVNWNRQAMEVSIMAVTAAVVFAVLDNMAPAISGSARQGAGFGLGANLVGFPVLR